MAQEDIKKTQVSEQARTSNFIKYQKVELQVTAQGQVVSKSAQFEVGYKKCTGFYPAFSDEKNPNQLMSEFGIKISNQEIFADDTQMVLLLTNRNMEFDKRFISISEPADGQKVDIKFSDKSNVIPPSPFSAYKVFVYFRLEKN